MVLTVVMNQHVVISVHFLQVHILPSLYLFQKYRFVMPLQYTGNEVKL